MKVVVSSIQRFSLHDGPGIRTTVFLKGCNLRCPWCSNPENIDFNIQEYYKDGIKYRYGIEYSLDDLLEIILKDKKFYKNNGGVTFSGGECLLQFKKIEPLLFKLKKEKINICIETALNVPIKFVEIALKYVDYFYIDMKIVDDKGIKQIGYDKELYIKNLIKIFSTCDNIVIRMPVVPGYTYTKKNISSIIEILKMIHVKNMEIFKIHKLGAEKYKTLGLKMTDFKEVTIQEINELKTILEKYVDNVKVIQI